MKMFEKFKPNRAGISASNELLYNIKLNSKSTKGKVSLYSLNRYYNIRHKGGMGWRVSKVKLWQNVWFEKISSK